MSMLKFFLVFLLLTFTCAMAQDHHHDDIKPSHGGKIIELSDEGGFIEWVHNDKTGEVTIYLLDPHGKAKKITEPPKLNVFIKSGENKTKKQIATAFKESDQKESDVFYVKDAALATKEIDGRVAIKIGEKSYQVPLTPDNSKKDAHKGHDHK